jgi:hypothetical protein
MHSRWTIVVLAALASGCSRRGAPEKGAPAPVEASPLRGASDIVPDARGGYLVLGLPTDASPNVRRHFGDGRVDVAFLGETRRFFESESPSIVFGWAAARGDETRFRSAPNRLFAVTAEGRWRAVADDETTAANESAARDVASSPWLAIRDHELVVGPKDGSKVIARVSVSSMVGMDEAIEPFRPTAGTPGSLPLRRGVGYLSIKSGVAKYRAWRSRVGADDIPTMDPAAARRVEQTAPPQPRLAGLLEVRLVADGTLRTRRIWLEGTGDVAASAESDSGDFAFVHQGAAKTVYWLSAGEGGTSVRPIASFRAPGDTVERLRFFPSVEEGKSTLFFLVQTDHALRVHVTTSPSIEPRMAAEIPLDRGPTGATMVSLHRVVWYVGGSEQPLGMRDF